MSTPIDLNSLPDRECRDCLEGKVMCKRPCWPTPAEARALMDAGYANKLMLEWWQGSPHSTHYTGERDVELLCPASPGFEGRKAPGELPPIDEVLTDPLQLLRALLVNVQVMEGVLDRGCVFTEPDTNHCLLHDRGLKPIEGRKSCCKDKGAGRGLHREVAKTWATEEGATVVALWKLTVGFQEEPDR